MPTKITNKAKQPIMSKKKKESMKKVKKVRMTQAEAIAEDKSKKQERPYWSFIITFWDHTPQVIYQDYSDLKSWKDAVKSITEEVGDDIKYIMKVSLARHNIEKKKDYELPAWHKFKTFYRFNEFPKEFVEKTITGGMDSDGADLAWMGYFEGVKDGLKIAPENCPNSSSSQISDVQDCWLETKCRACKFAFEDAKEDLHINNNHTFCDECGADEE